MRYAASAAPVAEDGMWEFLGVSYAEQPFLIDGIDVFRHEWQRVEGARAAVTEPRYGQHFEFPVYRVTAEGRTIEFAAGEFSNSVWGLYRRRA